MSAIDLQLICDTMYSWISSRTLVDKQHIFEEDPNVVRPKPPAISYRFLTLPAKVGTTDNVSYPGTGNSMTVSGPRDFTMSFKVFGEDARQIASDLKESLELFAVQQIFQAKNLAVRNAGTPQDISQEIETGIERRYNLDIVFGVMSIQTEDQSAIETVSISGAKIKDAEGTVKGTIDNTIVKP